MPNLGKPQGVNPFKNVVMSSKTENRSTRPGTEYGEGVRFVDAKEHNKMGKDGFLKLLTHQLANQDPTNPVNQKQFAADLAQFSQLEQLARLNNSFENMRPKQDGGDKFYAASLLGKEVLAQGNRLNYDGKSERVNIPFYLENNAQRVMVNIFDHRHQLVAQLTSMGMPKGNNSLVWDGTNPSGAKAVSGQYTFEIMAQDERAQTFKGQTKVSGIVTGVHFENGETVLTIEGGRQILLKEVTGLWMPESQKDNIALLKKDDASSYNQ